MKSSTKILSILAASSLVASVPVVLAQGTPPPPPPPAPPANAPAASGMAGRGGPGGPGAYTPPDAPTTDQYATLNKALKDLLVKQDPSVKAILDAHPTWNPLVGRGAGPGGNLGAGPGGRGRAGGAGG